MNVKYLSSIFDIHKDSEDKWALVIVDIDHSEERISYKELNLRLNLVC